jgi:hypothetical protein
LNILSGASSQEPSKEAQGSSTSNEANEARAVSLVSLEKGVRDNLMRLFLELDHDGDGSLNQKEFAAAKQLLSGVCGELPGSVKQPGVPVRSEDFMSYVASWAAAARVTLTQILREVPRQLARKPSNFDESVSELKQLGKKHQLRNFVRLIYIFAVPCI